MPAVDFTPPLVQAPMSSYQSRQTGTMNKRDVTWDFIRVKSVFFQRLCARVPEEEPVGFENKRLFLVIVAMSR